MASQVIRVDNKRFEASQSALSAAVSDIVVRDSATCLEAKKIQKTIRDEMKQRHFILDPFVVQAKASYDNARDERAKWIDPLEKLDDVLAGKVKTFEREEREAAQREQDRINAENARLVREKAEREQKERETAAKQMRDAKIKEINAALKAGDIGKREAARMLKEAGADAEAAIQQAAADAEAAKNAPPPKVEVKPNIPTVAGVPSRTNWRYRIVNANLIPDEYWMVNEQKLGADVRRDKEKTQIPGIEAYPD